MKRLFGNVDETVIIIMKKHYDILLSMIISSKTKIQLFLVDYADLYAFAYGNI